MTNWGKLICCGVGLTLLVGCGDSEEVLDGSEEVSDTSNSIDEASDTGTTTGEDTDEEEDEGCGELTLDIKGPDAPVVGDEWFVIMRCDNALMQGPTVIRFTPPDFANLDGKTVIFTTAGEASMRVQVGGYRLDTDIVVRP